MKTPHLGTPLGRIEEFLRQHAIEYGHGAAIASVEADPTWGLRTLGADDLRYLLETLERIKNLAYRTIHAADDNPFRNDNIGTIFHLASGTARGLAAPGDPRVLPLTIKPNGGGIYTDHTSGADPYAAGGGGLRTRTCVHCGRRCGDVPGGSGIVNAAPVCCPPDAVLDRPNCYRLLMTEQCDQVHVCQRGCWRDDDSR